MLADQLAALLGTRRVHARQAAAGAQYGPTLDPRLLVFEFTTGFVLRPQQVSLIGKLMGSAAAGESVCHQMLMGEGKTTVISPLLALLLGETALVMQIVPAQLLNFALSVLRGVFGSGALLKAVWTFAFDRRTAVTAELLEKARTAVVEQTVILSTPTAVKAFMLKLVELLHLLDTGQYPRPKTLASRALNKGARLLRLRRASSMRPNVQYKLDKPALHAQAGWAVSLLQVWRGAVAVIDEVDMVFHPLRSELNWPLGDRHPLDFEPTRWELPMRLLDAILCVQPGQTEVDAAAGLAQGVAAKLVTREVETLQALRAAVDRGVESKQLQKVPHLVVLDLDFYNAELRPHLTSWLLVWMRRRGLREVADEPLERCLASGGADESMLSLADDFVKMLNLGAAWLGSLLPHVLMKANRVHYGLLKVDEIADAAAKGNLPRSRRFLAVPFVGKDAPSPSSEYAHPDVAIGLSYLAYRFEGLRKNDFGMCVDHLVEAMQNEMGPELKRARARDAEPSSSISLTRPPLPRSCLRLAARVPHVDQLGPRSGAEGARREGRPAERERQRHAGVAEGRGNQRRDHMRGSPLRRGGPVRRRAAAAPARYGRRRLPRDAVRAAARQPPGCPVLPAQRRVPRDDGAPGDQAVGERPGPRGRDAFLATHRLLGCATRTPQLLLSPWRDLTRVRGWQARRRVCCRSRWGNATFRRATTPRCSARSPTPTLSRTMRCQTIGRCARCSRTSQRSIRPRMRSLTLARS